MHKDAWFIIVQHLSMRDIHLGVALVNRDCFELCESLFEYFCKRDYKLNGKQLEAKLEITQANRIRIYKVLYVRFFIVRLTLLESSIYFEKQELTHAFHTHFFPCCQIAHDRIIFLGTKEQRQLKQNANLPNALTLICGGNSFYEADKIGEKVVNHLEANKPLIIAMWTCMNDNRAGSLGGPFRCDTYNPIVAADATHNSKIGFAFAQNVPAPFKQPICMPENCYGSDAQAVNAAHGQLIARYENSEVIAIATSTKYRMVHLNMKIYPEHFPIVLASMEYLFFTRSPYAFVRENNHLVQPLFPLDVNLVPVKAQQ